MKAARKSKAYVLVSKLDRLSRDVHFISGLMARKVKFLVAELGPDVDPFMLHIYAAVAEAERKRIGQRTKDALAAARRRGVKLGNSTLAKANKAAAARRARDLRPFMQETLECRQRVPPGGSIARGRLRRPPVRPGRARRCSGSGVGWGCDILVIYTVPDRASEGRGSQQSQAFPHNEAVDQVPG
jgi:hypothetical protein